jgi:hypothetical protein
MNDPQHRAPLRERLFARLPSRKKSYGISPEDIAGTTIDSTIASDILDCIRSDDALDVGFGLYFATCLHARSDFRGIAESSFADMAELIQDRLSHADRQVRADAVTAFVAFRHEYDGYAAVMRAFLRDPDSEIRRRALSAASTFLSPKQLDVLLPFENDPSVAETGGMGGPPRYWMRDYALEIAEKIAGHKFGLGDLRDDRGAGTISWRSWGPFIRWLEQRKWKLFGR